MIETYCVDDDGSEDRWQVFNVLGKGAAPPTSEEGMSV
jgi:hypothetical protein